MSLNILKQRAAKKSRTLPNWVSDKNVSLAAYICINQMNEERITYINAHNQPKDYKKKGLF